MWEKSKKYIRSSALVLSIVLILAAAYFFTEKTDTDNTKTSDISYHSSSKSDTRKAVSSTGSSKEEISALQTSDNLTVSSRLSADSSRESIPESHDTSGQRVEAYEKSPDEETHHPEYESKNESSYTSIGEEYNSVYYSYQFSSRKATSQQDLSESEQNFSDKPQKTEKSSQVYEVTTSSLISNSEIPESKASHPESSRKTATETVNNCTLSITCNTLLDKTDQLKRNKRQLVPSNGIILNETSLTFSEGESVFDVTKRICTEKRIPFEFTLTPIYNTAYIEGIYNLYEFDCGSGSGWMYVVNGEIPGFGCSDYKLKKGDKIEWMYTCELGRDVERIIGER